MLLFVVALWNGNSLSLALDLWNLRIRIHSPDYRRIALHFTWCGRLEGNPSFPEQVLSAFSRWLARMASRRPSSGRDCVGSVRFLQTYPWLGRAFSLGDQGALRVFKQRSNSSWILLKSWTRVQSSGVSAWHTSYRTLVVFVDGPAASILGQNNFWDLLRRRRGFARSTCRANFRSSLERSRCGHDPSLYSISYVSSRRSYRRLRLLSAQHCLSCRSGLSPPF